jgi:hypothetical protein
MKTKINFSITKTITPKSRFIEKIDVTGNELTIKFANRPNLHHYSVTNEVRDAFLKETDMENFGHLYNQHLKGHSYSKTVFTATA